MTNLLIKFEGGDADRHEVDMRLLGSSMVGFERIISDGIILFSDLRLPRRGERAPLRVLAQPPREGSAEIVGLLKDVSGLLPLGWQIIQSSEGRFVFDWVSYVLKILGGRKNDAEVHMDAIIKLREIDEKARASSEALWHSQMAAYREDVFKHLDKLTLAAIQAVSPVGPSVRAVNFTAGVSATTEVDVPMADAIRTRGATELGDLQRMTLQVDGFSHHNKSVKIERPDEPGKFMTADVRDPAFETAPNIYTRAAEARTTITVLAKTAIKNGRLDKIYIMDTAED